MGASGHRKSKSIKVDFLDGGGKDEQTTEMLYKAMVEAQKAWEEQKKQIEVIQQTHDESRENSDEDDLPLRKAGKKGKNHLLLSKKKAKKSSSNDDDGNPVANGAKKKLSMLFGRRR